MMQEPLPNSTTNTNISDGGLEGLVCESLDQSEVKQQTSTLIEFPGTSRTVPEWRKQLSQRVREVQDRKAREAAEEAAAAQEAGLVSCLLPSAQLELVPNLEQPVRNPIVSKALERLERARRNDQAASGFTAAATATAPALESVIEQITEPSPDPTITPEIDEPPPVVSKPRLTVVAPSIPQIEATTIAEIDATATPHNGVTERKPVRVISDNVNDVALSYLETCLSVPPLASDAGTESAGFARRFVAGIFDLVLVALLTSPFAAAIEFMNGNWADARTVGLMSGIALVLMFGYFTIAIALTGRTVGMWMFSLRTIDLRTGMIPTGGQSMKRAFGYIFGLAFLGLGVFYGLIDRDRRTVHDRFSKTIVIKD
jgi:uncharacterized RDD family membrane protein YckC